MNESKYQSLFTSRALPHEPGFRTFQGTDCGLSSCCRNSTHFHCRACGYGTSQIANIVTHQRVCFSYLESPKELNRQSPPTDSSLPHDILQSTAPYSYYQSSSTTAGSSNSKILTTQESAMFNFVIPSQTSQCSSLYSTQSVFPNPNLFSPSSYNIGPLDPSWLPQPRLIPPGVHPTSTTSDLMKHPDSTSPNCCGRVETAVIGMCSPLTAEAYKVVSKEFQNSQNWCCNSQSRMNFNPSPPSCKFSDPPPCSFSLLLVEQNDLKQNEETAVDDLNFDKKSNSDTNKKESGTQSDSEESDIIVEESENEELVQTSKQWLTCLVCNRPPPQTNDFVRISKEMPLTTTSHVSVLWKFSQVVDDDSFNKLKNCLMCPRCVNLINVVDQLDFKLKSAKKELIDIYKSKPEVLEKDFEPDNKLLCQICDKQFSTSHYLQKHKQSHTKMFSYYCEYCGKGFAVLQKLENHLILHSNSSRFQCELCGKRFIQKHNLVDHIKKHKGEYKYQCSICKKGFIRRSVYKTHLLIHNSASLICQHCGKQFKNLSNLSVHIKLCSGDLKFNCEKCDKKFPIKSLLRKHISIKHDSQYRFVCSVCHKGFGKTSDLKTHMRSHSDNKPFKCSKCNKCYKSLSNLNHHSKVHSTGKVMECNICGKKFTRKDSLKDHLNQHTGNKPYKCTTCWKTFANRINYNSHVKRHSGTLKQTPCPVCGKMFSKGLKDHLVTHSGQKPHSCKHCQAVFTVKSSLNKHLKTKHGSSCSKSDTLN